MTEEEKLAKAYFILSLEPGSPMDKITKRHKRLIMVWHPDRFPTEEGKKDAEEELKQINNAKDDLKKHFESSHKASGPCACKPSAGASSQSTNQSSARSGQGPGPGPGRRKTTQENNREEAEAQRRSKEREQKAAQEAAEKERQRREAASAAATQQTAQQAADQTKLLEDERLRWKIALCIGAAWVGLSLFGWVGTSIKAWWHDVSWKWQNDHPSQSSSSTNGSTPGFRPSQVPTVQPYVAPYNQAPVQKYNASQWQDPYANNAQPPPGDTTIQSPITTASPSLSPSTPPPVLPGLSTTPNFPVNTSDPVGVRQRAQDFLNGTSKPNQ
jgi:hypothetical protein